MPCMPRASFDAIDVGESGGGRSFKPRDRSIAIMISRRFFVALAALACAPVQFAWAQQQYPSRAIRFIVPTGTGSGTDNTARFMAEGLGKAWGVPVVVENKLGAGGMIGTDFAAKAPPDGYTVLFNY